MPVPSIVTICSMARRARAVGSEMTRREPVAAPPVRDEPSAGKPTSSAGAWPRSESDGEAAPPIGTGARPPGAGRRVWTIRGGIQTPSLATAPIMAASCSVVTPISWPMASEACDSPDHSETSRNMPGLSPGRSMPDLRPKPKPLM